jgi:integrase
MARARPAKPRRDFPLFPHATGRWCKKVRGKFRYFGKVTPDGDHGAQAALGRWLDQKDDLLAGRTPRVKGEGLSVKELLNRFLTGKWRLVENGELAERTFLNYKGTAAHVVVCFGGGRLVEDLDATDFASLRTTLAKRYGPVALGVQIGQVRVVFKYAYDMRLVKAPVPFGPEFKGPSRRLLRMARNGKGPRMFEAGELRMILAAVPPVLRAMVLLGVNCGLGNSDLCRLPLAALDLKGGWLDYPRHKTGIQRRCPLWPETVTALEKAIADRQKPADPGDVGLVFLNRKGEPWLHARSNGVWDRIGSEFRKWLRKLGIKRPGLNLYGLRHTFRTIADGSLDRVAIDLIMGHTDESMGAAYRERIDDERLRAVVEHVRKWLFDSRGQDIG